MDILISGIGDIDGDPRPRRFIDYFHSRGEDVTVLAHQSKLKNVNLFLFDKIKTDTLNKIFRNILKLFSLIFFTLNLKSFGIFFLNSSLKLGRAFPQVSKTKFDICIVHDLFLLPAVVKNISAKKILFDAREYYPSQNEEKFLFRIIEAPLRNYLCKNFLKEINYTFTVSKGIANLYKKNFSTECGVFYSTPKYIKQEFSNCNKTIKFVHHGNANRNRKIEDMVYSFKSSDIKAIFDIYLAGNDWEYINELKFIAASDRRINIKEPVPYIEINNMLSNYDVGVFFFSPTTLNLQHAMPNKLFEFLHANLAILSSPVDDMGNFIRENKVGFVAEDFSIKAYTDVFQNISREEIDLCKKQCNLLSRKYNFETQINNLLKVLKV